MKIMLDPGHGGSDTGAVANGIQEKDVNLAVSLLVRGMIQTHRVEVLMTRQDDTYISLQDRTALANKESVDAFVSIHHNAATSAEARGLEVYHSIFGGEGHRLANLIHNRYRALMPELLSRGVRTRKAGDGRDYYHVIRATRMPAVIIEGGFLTNSQDAALIITRDFQEKQAQAISQAVLLWYGKDIEEGGGTQIIGSPRATVAQARKWARDRGAHRRFIDIAPVYWAVGQTIGIRPEVAYAQAAKETAFGWYDGTIKPEQNNWAGIKTRDAAGDRPEDHETFATPEDGVRAHFNHLAAYAGVAPLGEPHGRYHVVKGFSWAGSVRHVEELGGKWSPRPDYGRSIVRDYLEGLLATEAPAIEPPKPPAVDLTSLEERVRRLEEMVEKIREVLQ